MVKRQVLRPMLIEVAHRDGHLVEEVEKRNDFIAVELLLVAQQDLEGRPDAVGLHFAEDLALLAVHAVHDPGDVVDVLLVLLDLGVAVAEEPHGLLLAVDEIRRVDVAEQLLEQGGRPQVLGDVVGPDGVIAHERWSYLLYSLGHDLVQEQQVVDSLRVLKHSFAVL